MQSRFGGLDFLVNNVGGSSAPGGGVLALSDDELATNDRYQSLSRRCASIVHSFRGC